MSKVVRVVVVQGGADDYHAACEASLRRDGTSPVLDFLDALRRDACPDGQAEFMNPDVDLVHEWWVIMDRIKNLVRNGVPRHSGEINYLDDGIWEIKGQDARVPYFDVDDVDETHVPKPRIMHLLDSDEPGSDFWWYPSMATLLRITHGFLKHEARTRPTELELAFQIREEDLDHVTG